MSFKRNQVDQDMGNDDDAPFHKRQRFDDNEGGFRGGRGRGRDSRGFRGGRGGFNRFNDEDGGGFQDRRGRGGFRGGGDRFNRDDNGFQDRRGRGGFRGGGDRFNRDEGFRGGRGFGRGGGRGGFDGGRGFGRGRGGFGDRRGGGGFRGGYGGDRDDRSNFRPRESIIKIDQVAPAFNNILNENSESVSLQQYRGKYVVMFIYFRDGTFGCSTEQKCFRDAKEDFEKLNGVILGVSRDDESSHQSAVKEHELNFSLLADTDSKITESYGALDNGRVDRCTFIISPEGKVVAIWNRIAGFENHVQEVLGKLKEISSGSSDHKDDKKKRVESAQNEENDEDNEQDGNEEPEDDDDDE